MLTGYEIIAHAHAAALQGRAHAPASIASSPSAAQAYCEGLVAAYHHALEMWDYPPAGSGSAPPVAPHAGSGSAPPVAAHAGAGGTPPVAPHAGCSGRTADTLMWIHIPRARE